MHLQKLQPEEIPTRCVSPAAVFSEFYKYCYFMCLREGREVCSHLRGTVPQQRAADRAVTVTCHPQGLLPRVFGAHPTFSAPHKTAPVPTGGCWLTLNQRYRVLFQIARHSPPCRIKATAELHCWLSSPVSYFTDFAGATEII